MDFMNAEGVQEEMEDLGCLIGNLGNPRSSNSFVDSLAKRSSGGIGEKILWDFSGENPKFYAVTRNHPDNPPNPKAEAIPIVAVRSSATGDRQHPSPAQLQFRYFFCSKCLCRINEDELRRFYTAADGGLSCLLASIKKTIHWRETYRILSEEELEIGSNMVFWHEFDMEHRPCLIVRFGIACLNLVTYHFMTGLGFLKQLIEHGVLHLVDAENPHIIVLVDCEGLSPLRIPMQLLRDIETCHSEEGENHRGYARKVLSDYLQTLLAYLGGNCTCTKCSKISIHDKRPHTNETNRIQPYADVGDDEDLPSPRLVHQDDTDMDSSCHKVFQTAVIGILMVWALIALIAGMVDPENRPF
ncbi:hypothetical protein Q3G72_029408 [Acer saccharum]|nr:hypothetical protein Q3G72_029408 [Acer saccharum]